jgi:hypothetical protein
MKEPSPMVDIIILRGEDLIGMLGKETKKEIKKKVGGGSKEERMGRKYGHEQKLRS